MYRNKFDENLTYDSVNDQNSMYTDILCSSGVIHWGKALRKYPREFLNAFY
jgi:hypothetical protein